MHHLPFEARSFDLLFTNSLDHVFDLDGVLHEAERVLKPGGQFLIEAVDGSPRFRAEYESYWWDSIESLQLRLAQKGWKAEHPGVRFSQPWPGWQLFLRHPQAELKPIVCGPPRAQALARALQQHFGTREIVGAEIGVWEGELSRALLSELPNLSLYLVDPWESFDDYHAEGMIAHLKAGWEQAYQRALSAVAEYRERAVVMRATSRAAASRICDRSLDFVFIDANHAYEHVAADIRVWRQKLRSSGMLSGHDYHMEGVARAVYEICGKVEGGGVEENYVWWTPVRRSGAAPEGRSHAAP